jgi:hypothetical protein
LVSSARRRGRHFSAHFLRIFLICVHYTDLSASQSTAARATWATSATAAAASRVWTASATGPRGRLARLLSGPPGGGYAPLSFSALNLVVNNFCTGFLDWRGGRLTLTAVNLKFTGLTQNLGQLGGSNWDFQSNFWVNLLILGQPCEFYLISDVFDPGSAALGPGSGCSTSRRPRRATALARTMARRRVRTATRSPARSVEAASLLQRERCQVVFSTSVIAY